MTTNVTSAAAADDQRDGRCIVRDLAVLAFAQGFTLWHYKWHATPRPTDCPVGHFVPHSDLVKTGDVVFITSPTSGHGVMRSVLSDHRLAPLL